MAEAAKARASAYPAQSTDSDVLHFLARTLQAHSITDEPQAVLVKLQNLKAALADQQAKLSRAPDTASKTRMCTALVKANKAIAQIIEDLAAVPAESHATATAQAG